MARSSAPAALPRPIGARRQPVQSRGHERRDSIIDVAAQLVDELGPEAVTTTRIAERAGVSVGAVYSYFTNRQAIFDAIVARSIHTLEATIRAIRLRTTGDDFVEASCRVVDGIVHVYRTAPGFRALWFSQHVSAEMLLSMRESDEEQVRRLLDIIHARGLRLDVPDPAMALRMYVGLLDKGIDLAFRLDPEGDKGMIEETKRVVRNYLGSHLTATTDGPGSASRQPRRRNTGPARRRNPR